MKKTRCHQRSTRNTTKSLTSSTAELLSEAWLSSIKAFSSQISTSGEKESANQPKTFFISIFGKNHKSIPKNIKNYKFWSNSNNRAKNWRICQISPTKSGKYSLRPISSFVTVIKSRRASITFSFLWKMSPPNYQFQSPTLSRSSTTFVSKPSMNRPTTSATTCSPSPKLPPTWSWTTSSRAPWTPPRSSSSPPRSSQSFWATTSRKKILRKWSKALLLTSRWLEIPCTSTARRPRSVISQTHASHTSSSSSRRVSKAKTTSIANLEILDKIWTTK